MRRSGLLILTMAVALTVAVGAFLFGLPGFGLRTAEAVQTPPGEVWAWGDNSLGQLGDGTTTNRSTPVQASDLSNVVEAAGEESRSLALKDDGTVWTWGSDSSAPVRISGLSNITDIAAGDLHSLALKDDGTVWAWGINNFGQLGDGTTTNRSTPVQVPGLSNVTKLAAGNLHSLALKDDGTVRAWGNNSLGQLGDGTITRRSTPVQVSGLITVSDVAGGGNFSMAAKTDGTVRTWGSNWDGQLGNGSTVDHATLRVQVPGLSNVTMVAAGHGHGLALKDDGTVRAWGNNSLGQLGDGTITRRSTPVQVSGLSSVTKLAAGWDHSLALRSDGTVRAWGDNFYGQLGDGTTTRRSTPVQVSGLSKVSDVAGGVGHSLAVSDTVAPTVSSVSPAGGATDVAASANVTATFSEAMNAATISSSTFTLTKQGAASPVAAAVSYDAATKKATLNPNADLEPGASYTATLKSGPNGAKDLAGNTLATDKTWSFTTIVRATSGNTTRVSVDSSGNEGNAQSVIQNRSAVSADGRYVTFRSSASNLVAGDTNSIDDIFVHDRQTGTTERVNVSSSGEQANLENFGGYAPSISADGRYVAFSSNATNLVADDTNGTEDLFVHDRQTDITERVSVNGSGEQANGTSAVPTISGDGRYVAFHSNASNLVQNDANGFYDVFVRDRQADTTALVSLSNSRDQGNISSFSPSISADGRYVAFSSNASNLVTNDTNGTADLFVHDQQTGITERVSLSNSGQQASGDSQGPVISADGRYVAFGSLASDLVTNDTNGTAEDIFVRDRQTGTTELVNVSSSGEQATGNSFAPAISADGRYVTFTSDASNLVANDTNDSSQDIFVHDSQTGAMKLVSGGSSGVRANGGSAFSSISADGRYVAFQSFASNLVANDTNNTNDIFVHERNGADITSPQLNLPADITKTATGPDGAPVSFSVTATDDVDGSVPASCSPASGDVFPIGATQVTCSATDTAGNQATGTFTVTVSAAPTAPTSEVWGWGNNGAGQLGDGTNLRQNTPVEISELTDTKATAGGSSHSLALKNDGTVWALGNNVDGQLGDGTTTNRTTPVKVSGLTGAKAIASDGNSSLAVKNDGTVWAWGANSLGQLGDGTATNRTTPVKVSGLTDVKAVASGFGHSLALKNDGTVWAWGNNHRGQLGDGTTIRRYTPVKVSGITNVKAIATGIFSLAVKNDGTVWAWGYNVTGQLGDGTTTDRATPVKVSGLTDVKAITAGTLHSLAVKNDGTVWAWGNNVYGKLGDGTTINRKTPVKVVGLTNIKTVAGGYYHSLALKNDGTVWAWGNNGSGELGDGTTTGREAPVEVSSLTGTTSIASGWSHSLAVKTKLTLPEPTITSGPSGTISAGSARFEFSSSEAGATFRCKLDGAADFTNCSSPKNYTGLSNGDHTFSVRAVDSTGNVGPVTTRSWTIAPESTSQTVTAGGTLTSDSEGDGATATDPLETSITSPVAGTVEVTETVALDSSTAGYSFFGQQANITAPASTADNPLKFVFFIDSSIVPSGQDQSTIEVFRNGVKVEACADQSGVASPNPCVLDRSLLADGDIQLTILTSAASHWNFGILKSDTTVPKGTVKINGGKAYTKSPTVNLSLSATDSDSGVSSMRLKNDGGSWSAWIPYATSKSWTLNRSNGTRTVNAQYKDKSGNVSTTALDRIVLDTVKPTISAMSPRHRSITRDTTPAIKAVVRDKATNLRKSNIKLYVAGKRVTKFNYSAATDKLTYTSPRLPRDKKVVKIVARDAAGNVKARSWFFTIK